MDKKISELSKKEISDVCFKYVYYDCNSCPLIVEGYCYKGIIESLRKAKNRVVKLKKLLNSAKDQEVHI